MCGTAGSLLKFSDGGVMHFSMLKNDDVVSCFSLAYVSKQSGNKSGEMHETS